MRDAVSSQVAGCWQISRSVWPYPCWTWSSNGGSSRGPSAGAPRSLAIHASTEGPGSRSLTWTMLSPARPTRRALTFPLALDRKRKQRQSIEMKRKSQAPIRPRYPARTSPRYPARTSPRPSARTSTPSLATLSLSAGRRARLWRLLYGHGPANGTLMVLPLDQGLEHGPTDFFPNPDALDPHFQFRLAREGRYSAIALGVGLAEKYLRDYAGPVPLI